MRRRHGYPMGVDAPKSGGADDKRIPSLPSTGGNCRCTVSPSDIGSGMDKRYWKRR